MTPNDATTVAILSTILWLNTMSNDAHAYDLVVNNTSLDTYYAPITDGSPNKTWIGEMYGDAVFDSNGARIGLHQGYSFNFDNATEFNSNGVMYLEGGELTLIDDVYIVSATGIYEKYTGGTMVWNDLQYDPSYISEVTMTEPAPNNIRKDENNAGVLDDEITIRITSEGGHYQAIYGNSTGEQIGQVFQNPVVMTDSNDTKIRVGTNQGYSFLFPKGAYHVPADRVEHVLGNRKFIMEDGALMLVINEVLVHATGMYTKFIGGEFNEDIISADPIYVAEITLPMPTKEDSANQRDPDLHEDEHGHHFTITSKGGFFEPIVSQTSGEQIGERFQNPVFDKNQRHIGTDQGYGFKFPPSNYTNTLMQGNRLLHLEGGNLNVFNEVIITASGAYQKYTGGRFSEKIISYRPVFQSEVTLVAPAVPGENVANQMGPPVASPTPRFERDAASNAIDSTPPYVIYATLVTVGMSFL